MRQIRYIYLSLMVLVSCSKEISFSDINFVDDEIAFELAVDGFISNEYERSRVVLSKPVSIAGKIGQIPVEDAELELKHGSEVFPFQYDKDGIYYTTDSIAAVSGESYKLEIFYNGKTYTAEETMPDEPNDEFYIPFFYNPTYGNGNKPDPYDSNSVQLGIHFHNFGYERTNMWGFELSRFYNDTFPKLDVYLYFSLPIFTHKGSLPQGIFPPKTPGTGAYGAASDSIEILKAEISENYNQHLLEQFNETDWQGGMFSTIPGNVSTNLSEGAIGYFYAMNIKRKRFVIGDFDGHD